MSLKSACTGGHENTSPMHAPIAPMKSCLPPDPIRKGRALDIFFWCGSFQTSWTRSGKVATGVMGRRGGAVVAYPTLEATQWQILSQSPTDATRFWRGGGRGSGGLRSRVQGRRCLVQKYMLLYTQFTPAGQPYTDEIAPTNPEMTSQSPFGSQHLCFAE